MTFDCAGCGRPFTSDKALQQHMRNAPAHSTRSLAIAIADSFDLRPSLHVEVSRLLNVYGLSVAFFEIDDARGSIKEYDTSIMGTFTCNNETCTNERWTSKKIALTIRQYPGLRYNARVYYQRCKFCNSLSRPDLDSSYADRVSYRLAKWSGVALK